MTGRPRLRRLKSLTGLLVVLGMVPAILSMTVERAEAFWLTWHATITRDALGGMMSDEALSFVVGNYITGRGNLGSDRDQATHARHFDSARNREEICSLWRDGLNNYLNRAVALAAPEPLILNQVIPARRESLEAFGEALHALQDFYSHSNWVEIEVGKGRVPTPAPIIGSCHESELPGNLQTGFFESRWAYGGSLWGCPPDGPPDPFVYCHAQLSKDYADIGHGSKEAPLPGATGVTFHKLARGVATEATRQLWDEFHGRIVSTYTPETWNADGECLFAKLATGNLDSCLDLNGDWRFADSQTPVGVVDTGSRIVGAYDPSLDCGNGSFLDVAFDGDPTGSRIEGSINLCTFLNYVACGWPPSFSVPMTATVSLTAGRPSLHLSYVIPAYEVNRTPAGDVHCGGRTPWADLAARSTLVRA